MRRGQVLDDFVGVGDILPNEGEAPIASRVCGVDEAAIIIIGHSPCIGACGQHGFRCAVVGVEDGQLHAGAGNEELQMVLVDGESARVGTLPLQAEESDWPDIGFGRELRVAPVQDLSWVACPFGIWLEETAGCELLLSGRCRGSKVLDVAEKFVAQFNGVETGNLTAVREAHVYVATAGGLRKGYLAGKLNIGEGFPCFCVNDGEKPLALRAGWGFGSSGMT